MKKIIYAIGGLALFLTIGTFFNTKAEAAQTVYKDVDYSAVYDYDYYIAQNPNLAAAFGGNDGKVLEYFVLNGIDDGHRAKENFDVFSYMFNHKDLRMAYRNNLRAYYLHYISSGAKEGRKATGPYTITEPYTTYLGVNFSQIYDFEYYYSHYPDLQMAKGYDDIALLEHFIFNGIKEGRQAKEGVTKDSDTYKYFREKDISSIIYDGRGAKYPKALQRIMGKDLKAAFDIASSIPYFGRNDEIPRDPIWTTEQFADFGFDNGKGNCYVMAAMFYEMAYILGYNPRQMAGWVPSRTRGITQHSWVEIDIDGQTYVFDPDFTYSTKKNGFMVKYGTPGTWKYSDYNVM